MYAFFRYELTCRQIFTLDGSNDADLRMCVPFGGFIDIAPHLAGEIPSPKKTLI